MAERRSFDSLDDLERFVVEEEAKEQVRNSKTPYRPTRRPNRLWSLTGYTALVTIVFSIGYIGGIYSNPTNGSNTPWVIGPFGAPYANSPVYEELGASRPVSVKATHIGKHNPYTGTPSGDTSKAWKALMSGYNIRAPKRLLQPGQDSIPLADGSDDVVGSLGVFHYLHCLVSSQWLLSRCVLILTLKRTRFGIRLLAWDATTMTGARTACFPRTLITALSHCGSGLCANQTSRCVQFTGRRRRTAAILHKPIILWNIRVWIGLLWQSGLKSGNSSRIMAPSWLRRQMEMSGLG